MDRLDQIEEYLSKMTPGPWSYRRPMKGFGYSADSGVTYLRQDIPAGVTWKHRDDSGRQVTAFVCDCNGCGCSNAEDAAGIAALRTDATWLVERCRELEKAASHAELLYSELAEREGSQADRDAAKFLRAAIRKLEMKP